MVTVPDANAVTEPAVGLIIAIAVLLHVQTPPVTASLNEAVLHTKVGPDIGVGCGLTVTINAAMQPPPVVYLIVAVPGNMPATAPDPIFTLAIAGLRLLQVPPET